VKKFFVNICAVLMASILCFAMVGCGPDTPPETPPSGPSTPEVYTITIAGESVIDACVGDSITLVATPSDNFSYSWTSSNEGVATVSSAGKVEMIGEGFAVIKAEKTDDETVFASVLITVLIDKGRYSKTDDFENVSVTDTKVGTLTKAFTYSVWNESCDMYVKESEGNRFLQIENGNSAASWSGFDITINGLQVGKKYAVAFDVKVLSGSHYKQVNSFNESGAEYLVTRMTGDTFNYEIVPFAESFTFRIVTEFGGYTIKIDNVKVIMAELGEGDVFGD